jgi:retron-type reverse transcriptase
MPEAMPPKATVPAWVPRPLPVDAVADPALHARIDKLARDLPASLPELSERLESVRVFREYEAAANHASAHVWQAMDRLLADPDLDMRVALLTFAREHFSRPALARLLRRLVKDPSARVRLQARRVLRLSGIREVALPAKPGGDWDQTGWLHGTDVGSLSRHRQGRRVLQRYGLPGLANVGQLRKLLGVRSPQQLGYFLLATDADGGPYTKFAIPKRDGSDRAICAPKSQLLWTQRRILDEILAKVPAHDAAHGFVPGRSTVTNATPHLGCELLVKFDLKDFFPTIGFYRVVGLFARLGYTVEDGRFSSDDESRRVAATLARLCCYTPDSRAWHLGHAPQGAPTSPAISNLVCRRLDARLTGLAKKNGGLYTRYADDLTFSFKTTAIDLGRFRWWVDQVCQQEGFVVHQGKFRVIRASQRQVVTGLVVNDVLRVPRGERRRFRAVLYNCRAHGLESQARGRADFAGWLRGYASYIHMVHPEEGRDLLRQVEELLGEEPAP